MESALKERLVGAVVLVALGVWLIPLFLNGPERNAAANGGRRSLTLPVPAENQQDRTTKTIQLNANPAPTPKPVTKVVTNPVAKPVQQAKAEPSKATVAQPKTRPAPKPAPKSTPTSKPKSTTGSPAAGSGWFLQLGSFGSEANAKRLAAQISALGWDAQLSKLSGGDQTMHRVRLGPLPTRSKADALRGELAQRGFEGKVMNAP